MPNYCNPDGTITMRDSTNGSFMTIPTQMLIAIITKYVGTAFLPTNYDELKFFLKSVRLSDTINRRTGLSYHDGMHCSIVPLWYFSSGSTERDTEQRSCMF